MAKPVDQRKDKIIHVRCSLADYQKIEKSAKAHKQTISIFVYNLLGSFLAGESFTPSEAPFEPENCIQNIEQPTNTTLIDDLPHFVDSLLPDDIKGEAQVFFKGEVVPLLNISLELKRSLLSIRSDIRKGKTLEEIYQETIDDQTQKTQGKAQKNIQTRKPKARKKRLHKLS